MTGTSIDSLDLALAAIDGHGLELRARLVEHVNIPLGSLAPGLREAAAGRPLSAERFAELAWELGELHAEAIARLAHSRTLDLAVVHGQTLFHRPPRSLQLVNLAPIAARLRCRVVGDLRQADLAAGGEGAPITPLADWILLRDEDARRAIVNLGGFANLTVLPAGRSGCIHHIDGADLCACNQVLDAIARRVLDAPFDRDGAAASSGVADPAATDALAGILEAQRRSRRSLGTGDEAAAWIEATRDRCAPADLAASAVAAIARTIAAGLGDRRVGSSAGDRILLAGGGCHNRALVGALARLARAPIGTTADRGIPVEAREALAMAVLGTLAEDDVEITLEAVTGRRGRAGRSGCRVG